MKPIAPGDLVAVVRGHACDIGLVYRVRGVYNLTGMWICWTCKARSNADHGKPWATWDKSGRGAGAPLSWLQKIEPKSVKARETKKEVMA